VKGTYQVKVVDALGPDLVAEALAPADLRS
jgi:hypothetical protein